MNSSETVNAGFRAKLFDRKEATRQLELESIGDLELNDAQLLWVDVSDPDEATLAAVWRVCRLPEEALTLQAGSNPVLQSKGVHFWLRVVAVSEQPGPKISGIVLAVVAGGNIVVTLHAEPIDFVEDIFEGCTNASALASLSAESFVAALLDWQLSTYFSALSDYENAIERLENDILTNEGAVTLDELRRLRRWASRMRRMLAPHRVVFGAMSRPDFRPTESEVAQRHFEAIDTRFERAMDMVENARDLVLGSFELFSSKNALQTNERMKVLTFVTVITGTMATVVGALGMNFQASLFQSRDTGFWIVVAGMVLLTVTGLILGRYRKWY